MREFAMNYYNEFDQNAVAWLRELIKLGAIPAGDVDERSIVDVCPNDLKGYTQCHFFAGIGGWSLAMQRAGIASDRALWTGSCPCQDFSCAGKQKGFGGERDLWPAFFNLIRERRPERVFGEQVKNAVRHGWLDRLYADLEGEGYVCGSTVLGAHSAGADHIRQRIYWVADAVGIEEYQELGRPEKNEGKRGSIVVGGCGMVGGMEDPACLGRGGRRDGDQTGCGRPLQTEGPSSSRGLVNPVGERGRGGQSGRENAVDAGQSSQARNFWSDARPHLCKDGKWRRFEPGVFPLVAKLPRGMVPSSRIGFPIDANQTSEARVMRLKGYGNAICVDTAVMFIETCEDILK